MKLPFTIYDLRFTIEKQSAVRAAANRQSSIINHKSRSGVALIVTLILLSAALVMALAFLAISSRDKGSITTQTDTATTRLAADAGLAAAEAQIAANVLSTTNPYNFGLLVSTNYINPAGFASGFNNVNYDRSFATGLPLTPTEFLENLTNLWFSPRAPVLISTNEPAGRFYLDLNRNGHYDTNGVVGNFVINASGQLVFDGTTSFQVGDPEWIGVLEFPDQPYGPKNPFIARFAFIALPVGNSLDLNTIHNQVFDENNLPNSIINPPPAFDGYFRNQGVGPWELNLAAFLADLNTNQWGNFFTYQSPFTGNSGVAFDDARALLAYRYANNYSSLATAATLLNGAPGFNQDGIDGYSDGPLQTTTAVTNENIFVIHDNANLPWAGADNTNHFFTPEGLFDLNETAVGVTLAQMAAGNYFSNRLARAGNGISTYDRYTFYRMLSQLGTDTAPESGKMNLNYDNLVQPNLVSGAVSETNFIPWTPLSFFTNAADRLLKAYTEQWAAPYTNNEALFVTGLNANLVNTNFVATFNVTAPFGVTAIPVLISNQFVYTPAVNRLLQLAANMYDATTTNLYPDIYRPLFNVVLENGYTDVYISGYTNQDNFTANMIRASQMVLGANGGVLDPPIEANTLLPGNNILANVYGVPWIIGAKKGFPNFNEFTVESAFQLTRKLEVVRDTNAVPQPDIILTNQMYLMNITNYYGVEFWNSYRSNYPGPVDIVVRCTSSMMLTNDSGLLPPVAYINSNYFQTVQEMNPWYGWNGVVGQQQTPSSFVIPLDTNVMGLTNAIYFYNNNNPELLLAGNNPVNYLDQGIRPLPHFGLLMTNRLQVAIIDYSAGLNNGRIVDYVQLGGMDTSQDLNSDLQANDPYHFWDMTYTNGTLLGVLNQIQVSMYGVNIYGQGPTGSAGWNDAPIPGGPAGDTSPPAQQAFFKGFFASDGHYYYPNQQPPPYYNTQSAMQAPYTPSTLVARYTSWQANDPLVHYLSSDLASVSKPESSVDWPPSIIGSLNSVNSRYQPWGQRPPSYVTGVDQNPANLSFKDPLVHASDNWDFPANKLPTVGWLGRVHRGTPWQTVYLKSTNILAWTNNSAGQNGANTWVNWTGDLNLFDMSNSAPVEDRLLFDLFTTAFNDNATRGQLSVNVSSNSLAAWSAVFSGVTVLTNNLPNANAGFPLRYQNPLPRYLPPGYTNMPISPAGIYNSALPLAQQPLLAQLVAGIDQTRATFTNRDGLVGAFEHKGDILAVPQLTEQSPFLNWTSAAQRTNGISDEMYEWLPQQVMSLLRDSSSPRYVIYSWGQTLKPAQNGIYLGATPAGMFGLVTNYQVVSEINTRAVVRFDTVRTNVIGPTPSIIVTPPRAVIESFNILPPD